MRYPHHCPHCVYLGAWPHWDLHHCHDHDGSGEMLVAASDPQFASRPVAALCRSFWVACSMPGCWRDAMLLAASRGIVDKRLAEGYLAGIDLTGR